MMLSHEVFRYPATYTTSWDTTHPRCPPRPWLTLMNELERLRRREVELEAQIHRLYEALAHASSSDATALIDLRAIERRNRQIIDSVIDFAIVATNIEGLVTRWSDGACHVLGWSEGEMLGHPVDRFFTPEDVAAGRVATEMRNALEIGRGNDERWHQRKDGERFWAVGEMTVLRDDGGAAIGFVKVLRDRTEQRHAEEQRRSDAEFMRGVLASSSDCIKVLDLDGNLTFMSEGGQRVMEVSDFNAIQGCPWPDFWQGQGRHQAETALAAAKAGGVGHFQGPADTVAGTPRYWDVRVTAIMDVDGRPEKLLSISCDITAAWGLEDAMVGATLTPGQVGLLATVIIAVEAVVIGGHVALATRARALLRTPRVDRRVNRAAGGVMIGAGVAVIAAH